MEINSEVLKKMKLKALLYYKENKKIISPIFGEIRITNSGFNHIEWKNKVHKRDFKEAYVRYICFFHTKHILEQSNLYQEFRERIEQFKIKIGKRKYKNVNENTCYYGFVAIVNKNKHRVRIVIKKHNKSNYYEFVSVVPAWKKDGYLGTKDNILFFDEKLE